MKKQPVKNIYFLLIPMVFLFHCTNTRSELEVQKPGNKLSIINIEESIKQKSDVLLSDIAADITYIPLETQSNSFVANISSVKVTDSFIFVNDGKKLLQFNRQGTFIRQIGKAGRGPGEYSNILNFSVNEQANTILILGGLNFYKYDIKGEFIKKITNRYGMHFNIDCQNRIAFNHGSCIEDSTCLILTDLDVNPIIKFKNNQIKREKENNPVFNRSPLYTYKNNLFFKDNFNDTLYCVEDSLLKPYFIYTEKNLRLDESFNLHSTGNVSDLKNQLDKVQDKLMMYAIFESEKYILSTYLRGVGPFAKDDVGFIYEKDNEKTIAVNNGILINDFDGGKGFWPISIYNDKYLINYFLASELKSYIDSDAFNTTTAKYPEKKKELAQLANSLDENDNPVLMLVKLKE